MRGWNTRAAAIGVGCLFTLAGQAGAQSSPPKEEELPAFERGAGEPVAPAGTVASQGGGLDTRLSSLPPDFDVPGAQVVPEGTYLPRVVGRAVRTARGEVVFAPDATQPPEFSTGLPSPLPLLVLLPNVRRDQLGSALLDDPLGVAAEPVAAATSAPKPYAVGGQVYLYHGRSYLLCSTFAAVGETAKTETPGTPDSTEKPTSAVDQLISDLEKASQERRVLTPGVQPRRRERQDDTVIAAVTDGSVVTNKRGRLVALPEEGGRLAFTIDNDPDSPGASPMLLLPCQVLEEIENVVAARGPEVTVRMSGRIVASGSKAALLPVFFQVERRSDLTPGQ
ncbi:MAG TPA: hypothetical protein VHN77_00145 [Phycisphaerales bacterium]|nr:hypothetical protein [Phycisphaerales bacterium]